MCSGLDVVAMDVGMDVKPGVDPARAGRASHSACADVGVDRDGVSADVGVDRDGVSAGVGVDRDVDAGGLDVLRALVAAVDAVVAVDADTLPAGEDARWVQILDTEINRLSGAKLGAVATMSRRETYRRLGQRSVQGWLQSNLRMSAAQAKKETDTAAAVDTRLSSTRRALANGDINVEHAAAIATAARTLPDAHDAERPLLAEAKRGDAAHVRRLGQRLQAAADAGAAARREGRRAYEQRTFTLTADGTGRCSPRGACTSWPASASPKRCTPLAPRAATTINAPTASAWPTRSNSWPTSHCAAGTCPQAGGWPRRSPRSCRLRRWRTGRGAPRTPPRCRGRGRARRRRWSSCTARRTWPGWSPTPTSARCGLGAPDATQPPTNARPPACATAGAAGRAARCRWPGACCTTPTGGTTAGTPTCTG